MRTVLLPDFAGPATNTGSPPARVRFTAAKESSPIPTGTSHSPPSNLTRSILAGRDPQGEHSDRSGRTQARVSSYGNGCDLLLERAVEGGDLQLASGLGLDRPPGWHSSCRWPQPERGVVVRVRQAEHQPVGDQAGDRCRYGTGPVGGGDHRHTEPRAIGHQPGQGFLPDEVSRGVIGAAEPLKPVQQQDDPARTTIFTRSRPARTQRLHVDARLPPAGNGAAGSAAHARRRR